EVVYDTEQSLLIDGIRNLIEQIGEGNFGQPEQRLKKLDQMTEYPAFTTLKQGYEADNRYRRLPDQIVREWTPGELEELPIIIGLDVGSTMAKLVVADSQTEEILFLNSYSNCGDTIETIKQVFHDLQSRSVSQLAVVRVGITGSARYQVQEALRQVYPQLGNRISVLVENYAHARGSIEHARRHIRHLKESGVGEVNEDFIILVDIGGEDTKLSTISLKKGELFDNAMNVKCSAGTGSLIDSLRSLFGIESVAQASSYAFQAKKAYAINATCAVFLMENTRNLQAQGYREDEILASANWAIVENMARTLWSQLDLPQQAVIMLHGQTMLSEPLPLAVTHRLQEYIGATSYCLVPPNPGHMACIGLIKTLAQEQREEQDETAVACTLEDLIKREFKKRIIQCRGAACGDQEARCNRVSLSGKDSCGKRFNFSLGGCTAINDFVARKSLGNKPTPDTYKEIWSMVNDRLPHTEEHNRLVIPRSFAVSEWAFFLSRIFEQFDLPVHVDNVREHDLISAQPFFHIDTCAPQIGAVGQYRRLAGESHGMILAPQIEYLPSSKESVGRTCTINQGGVIVAKNLSEVAYPEARIHAFNIDFKELEPDSIAHQLYRRLGPVFEYYGIEPTSEQLHQAVVVALDAYRKLRGELEERAADIIETAIEEGRQVAVVAGREYILNPGIYDSHVGRLLRDKQISALPLYILNMDTDPDLAHIYWRNPHFIVTVLRAIAEKRLHEKLNHPRLKRLFRQLEEDSADDLLPVVQVSTFRCGPDSITTPLVAEIMKKRPFLLIQSDAAIKELAHLENRVNTYVKQLELGLHGELMGADGNKFEIQILENFTNNQALD
ncbi:MAG: hypothetical protein GY731_12810, partial [Gammaproteobacteria bacterium]|nr:hypothetical protein [Gammaproteobacteria bacterium]